MARLRQIDDPAVAPWGRLEQLEAESAIRRLMAEYMRLCDSLDAQTPMDQLGALFAKDAVWVGRGARYGAAFGRREGRAAIVAWLDGYRRPPHFTLNAHFLSSEAIAVEGAEARGRWMMLQLSTYANGSSDLRGARLEVGFVREDDAWRIGRFETENLFSRRVAHWNDEAAVQTPESGSHDD
jgi:hypothetical protein